MKKISVLLFSLSFLLLAFQVPVQLKKTKISDHISVNLPENFRQVGEQELSEKYVSTRPPIALYTSQDGLVDFSVNLSATQWQHFDLPLVKDFYKASLSTLYSELKMIKEEVVEVNKHQMAIFEFIGTVAGEETAVRRTNAISKYTYIAYALVNGKVVVCTLTAPAKLQQSWAPVAEEMMNTIRIKKTL